MEWGYPIIKDYLNRSVRENGSYSEHPSDKPIVSHNGSWSSPGIWDHSKSEGERACGLYFFLLTGVLCGLVCVLGLFGNAFSLAVLSRLGRDSVTYLLLCVLAGTDIVFLSGYLLFSSIPDIIYFFHRGPTVVVFVTITRYGLYPVLAMAHSTSVWITTLVTTYRYITASRHLRQGHVCSRVSMYAQVAFIISFCVLFEIPRYWEREPTLILNTTFIDLEPTNVYYDDYYQIFYKSFLSFIFRRLIPLTLTAIMVWKRVRLLETWRQSRARTLNKPSLPEEQERLSKVLIVLAVVFVVTHIPITIYPVIRAASPPSGDSCNSFYFYFSYFADFLVVLNSAATFYILYPVIPRYRRAALQVICQSRLRRPKIASESTDISHVPSRI